MIDLIFALLNTGILVAVLIYLFRSAVRAKIERAMAWDHIHVAHLTTRYDQAAQQEKKLIKSAQHQQSLYEELSVKMTKWHQGLHEREMQMSKIREILEEQCEARMDRQQQFRHQRIACTQLSPKILCRARERLEAWASDELHAQRYIAEGMARLKTLDSVASGDTQTRGES